MNNDLVIDSINISALSRNCKKMIAKIIEQDSIIKILKKDLRLAFARIDDLQKAASPKSSKASSNPFGNLFN